MSVKQVCVFENPTQQAFGERETVWSRILGTGSEEKTEWATSLSLCFSNSTTNL